jgi:hypothetical protein
METSLLRLFNAVLVNNKVEHFDYSAFKRTIKNGYVLSPYIPVTSPLLLDTIESVVGISGEKANSSFHKSWSVIKNSTMEQLVIQQIVHYITTYGFERLGIYSEDTVYIPHEALELPAITTDIPLTVIKAMTVDEILDNILVLAESGIALSKETLTDIMTVIKALHYAGDFVPQVKNRELKALLYDFYNIAPIEPVEYLRYLVGKLTGESLLIKNKYLIEKIKASDVKTLDSILNLAPKDLASIFYRFKPLFLAMKSISNNKTFFNKLRKDAVVLHKPLPEDYLNTITSKIKNDETFDFEKFAPKLRDASTFRKIRLAYALNNRLHAGDSIVYKIRNGRGWATDFTWDSDGLNDFTSELLKFVVNAIAEDIKTKVNGKVIYIPSSVHYALPATEKQFLGNIPANSYVSIPNDMVVGIHWFNTGNEENNKKNRYDYYGYGDDNGRVDLDLSMLSLNSKYGWDGYYRSSNRDIMFSGDVTSAPKPNGASEFFYLRHVTDEAKTLYANYFNFRTEGVNCKLIIASEKVGNLGNNYMVNVNNIIATANINLTKKQNLLGLIIGVDGENRFYFSNTSIGDSITTRSNDVSVMVNKFMENSCHNIIEFADVLEKAGATVVSERPENGEEFIDLSPEVLDKNTFIKLLV